MFFDGRMFEKKKTWLQLPLTYVFAVIATHLVWMWMRVCASFFFSRYS